MRLVPLITRSNKKDYIQYRQENIIMIQQINSKQCPFCDSTFNSTRWYAEHVNECRSKENTEKSEIVKEFYGKTSQYFPLVVQNKSTISLEETKCIQCGYPDEPANHNLKCRGYYYDVFCGKVFNSKYLYDEHEMTKDHKENVASPNKQKYFPELLRHHYNNYSFQCGHCNVQFEQSLALEKHVPCKVDLNEIADMRILAIQKYADACRIAGVVNQKDVYVHDEPPMPPLPADYRGERYTCELCNFSYKSKEILVRHLKYTFRMNINIKDHRTIKCIKCGRTFSALTFSVHVCVND